LRSRRARAASPAGQSCSSNSRSAQRSDGRSQRRPQTPHDATPGLSSARSASSRRLALPHTAPADSTPVRRVAQVQEIEGFSTHACRAWDPVWVAVSRSCRRWGCCS
jgi:hypothetical protein